MDLDLLRLLIDFGFVILIWAVQLVIYPSFLYYSKENLIKWHHRYTKRVTVIVLPLMTAQLVISIVQFSNSISSYTISSLVLIGILWILTFLVFVPRHQQIDKGEGTIKTTQSLVSFNWIRTILWTLLFIISLIQYNTV